MNSDRAWAEEMKMGSFLSVTNGSLEPCKFLEVIYNGGKSGEAPFAIVGKGITFDRQDWFSWAYSFDESYTSSAVEFQSSHPPAWTK
jgi:hypothetical protein